MLSYNINSSKKYDGLFLRRDWYFKFIEFLQSINVQFSKLRNVLQEVF